MTTLWAYRVISPPQNIEEAESPFLQSVPTLDAWPPPFTIMPTDTKIQQFYCVVHTPFCKTEIVVCRGDPSIPATGEKSQSFRLIDCAWDRKTLHLHNPNLCIRAVDFFRNNHLAG